MSYLGESESPPIAVRCVTRSLTEVVQRIHAILRGQFPEDMRTQDLTRHGRTPSRSCTT